MNRSGKLPPGDVSGAVLSWLSGTGLAKLAEFQGRLS